MIKDEIDTMWQKAMCQSIEEGEMYTRYHFAKMVAEAEREACAKECEHTALRMGSEWMAQHCAEAIRARGDKHETK
jgi:hypothetical protein